jgi:hypothetical protein
MAQSRRTGHMAVSNTVGVSAPVTMADNRRALEVSLVGNQRPGMPL